MKYDKITRCNNFLENISRPDMDEELRTRLTAEVRFLRAWHYFLKVTLYGDVPLVKEVLDITNSNLPRTPKRGGTIYFERVDGNYTSIAR